MTGLERAQRYIDDIFSGKIPANVHIKAAIQRFKRDIERQGTEDFPYVFRPELGERFIQFAELLKLTNDQWAGTPLKMMDWQCFLFMNVYSWVHKDTGSRRFRKAVTIVSRKCGKSSCTATTALWDLLSTPGSQVCLAATTRAQAKLVFDVIRAMVEQNEILSKRLKIYQSTSTIVNYSNYGKIEVLSSESKKTGDGKNCSLGIFDECSVSDWGIYKIIESGQGSRPEPLNFMISSCSSELDSMGHDEWERCTKILQGVIEDDSTFALLYGLDEGDDYHNENLWPKAIPSLGVTVNVDFVRKLKLQAEQQTALLYEFLNKIMCVWTTNEHAWITDDKWLKCVTNKKPDMEKPYYANMSIDLSKANDLTSLSLCVYQDGKYYMNHWLYFPKDSLPDRIKTETEQWNHWFRTGVVTATPGFTIDYDWLLAQIEKIGSDYEISEILMDPYNSNKIINELADAFTVVPVSQNLKSLSPYTKTYEKEILNGNIVDNNPFMRWAMSNAMVYVDANDNIKVIKNSRKGKSVKNLHIDPVVTSLMCVGRIRSLLDEGEIDLRDADQKVNDVHSFLEGLKL